MKNFTAPKTISPFYNAKRISRKKKKKYKEQLNKYPFLTLNQKLWVILGQINPQYKQFLITEIIRRDEIRKRLSVV